MKKKGEISMSKKGYEERKREIKDKLTDAQIEIQPFYYDLRNKIVQPKNVVVESKYFWDKWKPRLGPNLTVIIIELRRRCYYNPETGEKRDYCWPSLKTIASSCGISVSTLQRELKRPEAKLFIRIEPRYIYNEKIGRMSRTTNIYYVAMDDPLLPEDKESLKDKIAEQIIEKEGLRRDFEQDKKSKSGSESKHKGQIDHHIAWSNCTSKTFSEEILPSFNDKRSSNAEENQRKEYLSSTADSAPTKIPDKEDMASLADMIASKLVEEIVTQEIAEKDEKTSNGEGMGLVVDTYEDKESGRVEIIDASVDIVAHELADELRDFKSLNFYQLIASRCPTSMVYEILAQVKEAQEMGIVRTTPARLFTAAIKKAAQEAGIDLESKVKFKRKVEWGPIARKPWKLALNLAEELEDIKGIAYYKKIAKECPVKLLRWCLEEVKRQGRAVENKGALFNFLVKREMDAFKKQEGEKIIPPEELHIRIAKFKKQSDKDDIIVEEEKVIEEVKQKEQRRDVDPKLRKELCKYINDWTYVDKLIQKHTEEELERFLARFQEEARHSNGYPARLWG